MVRGEVLLAAVRQPPSGSLDCPPRMAHMRPRGANVMQEVSPNRVRWVSQTDMLFASAHFDEVSERLNPLVDRTIAFCGKDSSFGRSIPRKC